MARGKQFTKGKIGNTGKTCSWCGKERYFRDNYTEKQLLGGKGHPYIMFENWEIRHATTHQMERLTGRLVLKQDEGSETRSRQEVEHYLLH